MLVLSRKIGERIVIGRDIEVVVVDIRGDKVRLGIEAPRHVEVNREEVRDAIANDNRLTGQQRTHAEPGRVTRRRLGAVA